jgi:suppressor for copper-sensitivity B
MIAVILVLALAKRLPGRTRVVGGALAAALALASFGLPLTLSRPSGEAAAAAIDGKWVGFDESAIAAHVAAGRTVFVDVTADWCITCQANKRLVLSRETVAERLFKGDIVTMRADWTRPDERIAAYLASFGRYGIPFNIVYGPKTPAGVPLPEILSEGAVLSALDAAG